MSESDSPAAAVASVASARAATAPIGASERLSTRIAFFIAGLAMAAWAPLVPYAKARTGVDEGTLGLLLLALGAGSLMTMPLTGAIAARYGCRRVILLASAVVCASLPLLAQFSTVPAMALSLFVFGAAIGTIDVAINIQAVIVEKASGRPLMSGFHGFFSVGGIAGAGLVSIMLWLQATPLVAALSVAVLLALLMLLGGRGLLRYGDDGHGGSMFVLPHGVVILIGALCFIVFLAEGAMLDWSALLLVSGRGVAPSVAGIGYAVFALAMTVGRFNGDRIVQRFGPRPVLALGGACAAAGFLLAALLPWAGTTLLGFALVGLGCSNIVPILFTAAGNQKAMPAGAAVSAISTLGYAGILAGPAGIGWIAKISSLPLAFLVLGAALVAVAASARIAAAKA
ncbi:MFS transporter [Lysobacter gummosus]|uniref:MFS transporter n=1 Tax=Lysobacter gummosus TaxID=262324 RepID=A0ABY3X589_9GAMM|nr:MFS transporter [Lysobacter gummosus]ALN92083.1 major Facilitator Superfamily protein [Lysobacter gummosus]UNP27719.1 MFS transporter [Lysobacter gummosus]